jgi:hypothetical protein
MLTLTAYGVWAGLDHTLGRSIWAQVGAVGGGILAGSLVYAAAALASLVVVAAAVAALHLVNLVILRRAVARTA